MITIVNKLIEKHLLAYLYKERSSIILKAFSRFEKDYPEATNEQKSALKTKLMLENTRVSPIVDHHSMFIPLPCRQHQDNYRTISYKNDFV
jgi:hypothetical protein